MLKRLSISYPRVVCSDFYDYCSGLNYWMSADPSIPYPKLGKGRCIDSEQAETEEFICLAAKRHLKISDFRTMYETFLVTRATEMTYPGDRAEMPPSAYALCQCRSAEEYYVSEFNRALNVDSCFTLLQDKLSNVVKSNETPDKNLYRVIVCAAIDRLKRLDPTIPRSDILRQIKAVTFGLKDGKEWPKTTVLHGGAYIGCEADFFELLGSSPLIAVRYQNRTIVVPSDVQCFEKVEAQYLKLQGADRDLAPVFVFKVRNELFADYDYWARICIEKVESLLTPTMIMTLSLANGSNRTETMSISQELLQRMGLEQPLQIMTSNFIRNCPDEGSFQEKVSTIISNFCLLLNIFDTEFNDMPNRNLVGDFILAIKQNLETLGKTPAEIDHYFETPISFKDPDDEDVMIRMSWLAFCGAYGDVDLRAVHTLLEVVPEYPIQNDAGVQNRSEHRMSHQTLGYYLCNRGCFAVVSVLREKGYDLIDDKLRFEVVGGISGETSIFVQAKESPDLRALLLSFGYENAQIDHARQIISQVQSSDSSDEDVE